MAVYRLTDRIFSRQWRRNKDYAEREIRRLARRRGLLMNIRKQTVQVLDPKTHKVVANFQEVPVGEAPAVSERLRNLAALKVG